LVEVELNLATKQNLVYIPKILVSCLGRRIKVTPNSIAAVMYPTNAGIGEVLESLKIITQTLEAKKRRAER
jgi:hypothetical protein